MRLSIRAYCALGALAAAAILAACSASDVIRPDIDVTRTAALVAPPRGMQSLVPNNPYLYEEPRDDSEPEPSQEAAPGMTSPSDGWQSEPEPVRMPQSEIDCRDELRRLGASFTDLSPINDGGACRIDWPVKLTGMSGNIAMKPGATLTCQMAVSVARWTKNELGPSTRMRYFTGVKAIHQGSSYSCRRIRGSSTMSEHSKGNALDIMRIELDSGKDIGVRKPGFFRFREKSLLNNVRADACDYFSTVLGPGYDRDHKDHFHFDLAQRRSGRKTCK